MKFYISVTFDMEQFSSEKDAISIQFVSKPESVYVCEYMDACICIYMCICMNVFSCKCGSVKCQIFGAT